MSAQEDGIDAMRDRISRGRRQPPQSRRPVPVTAPKREPDTPAASNAAIAPATEEPSPQPAESGRSARLRGPRMRLAPTLPWANLAIRVRRPLDERLADLIDDLRRTGTRTSKVELIEMLLWELEPESTEGLKGRLGRFRRHAPRTAAAEFGED